VGEHRVPRKLGDVPGHRSAERAPPKFVHVSKELHMEPIVVDALDADGNPIKQVVGYKFVLHRGDGKTFERHGPRPRVRNSRKNDWGAEPYKLHRERSDAAYQVRLERMALAAELL
jgi:hypothetical protein